MIILQFPVHGLELDMGYRSRSYQDAEKGQNRLLTRAAQNRVYVNATTYGAGIVRERFCPSLLQHYPAS
jgi:hypothetical protein